MTLRIFDTGTRTLRDFKPVQPGHASVYLCGATPQSSPHIGHVRSAVAFDILRRWLMAKGLDVAFVRNVTDIDDKILTKASENGRPWWEWVSTYEREFTWTYNTLGVLPPSTEPRATGHVTQMIKYMQRLIDNGFAYAVDGSVYFDVAAWSKAEGSDYGSLSGNRVEDMEQGEPDNFGKRGPQDFALWKAAKPGEPSWPTPWGDGRPGWHLECSAMATYYLGEQFDIHCGGLDLQFPHHENEIAQSEAKTGKKFVNYWLHNGFVTVGKDQEKMSKSLHNFVTVHDILKEVDPQVLRFFMASVQYRRQINYSAENLQQAATILDRFKNTLVNINYRLEDDTPSEDSSELATAINKTNEEFEAAMDDDFNVQNALTAIYDLLPVINANANAEKADKESLKLFKDKLSAWLLVFGIDTEKLCSQSAGSNDDEIDQLVKKRDEARKNKDWATSDQIRDQLKEMGITIQDTPQGTRWTRD